MKKSKSHKSTGKPDRFLPDGRQKIVGVRSISAPPVQIGLKPKSAWNRNVCAPCCDYCCSVWDCLGETLSCKIQNLQNRAARVIMRANYDDSASIHLDTLHWDNLSLRPKKLKAGLMFNTLKGNMPSYLQNMFSFRGLGYNIRNSQIRLNLPKPRTNYLKRSFCYSGAILWNSLPQDIRKL